MLLEAMGALVIVAAMLALMSFVMTQLADHNRLVMTRQRATLAAESVLNELRAGEEFDAAAFGDRFPSMLATVIRTPGLGEWEGLALVQVRVDVTIHPGRVARGAARGYVREDSP
jgi:hypothetical protein